MSMSDILKDAYKKALDHIHTAFAPLTAPITPDDPDGLAGTTAGASKNGQAAAKALAGTPADDTTTAAP